jgi:hypothetical protein
MNLERQFNPWSSPTPSTKVWTLDLQLTGQMLCHLSYATTPFCFSHFLNKALLLCPGQCGLWPYISWDDMCLTLSPAFHCLRWGLTNFLPDLAPTLSPPDLYILWVTRITDVSHCIQSHNHFLVTSSLNCSAFYELGTSHGNYGASIVSSVCE